MDKNRKRRTWSWGLGTLALLPVLYVLSIGPVWWIACKTTVFTPALTVVYAPIFWADHHGPKWFADFTQWYLRLWIG